MSQDKSRGVLESNSNQHQIVPVSVTIVLPKQVFHPTLTVTVCTLIGILRSVPITSTVVVSVVKIIVLAIILLFQFLKIQVTLLLLVQLVALSLLKITTTTTASYSGIIAYHYYNTPTKRAACTKRIIPSFRSHQYYRLPTRSSFCPATTTTNNYFRSRRGRELPPLNHWWKHPTMAYHTSSSTAMGTQDSSATDVVPPLHEQHPHTKQQQPSSSSSVSEAPIIVARRVSASLDSLQKCGDRLRNGYLVSFPTETVYGLGCHALDPQAISKVYAAKERPFTDPLILHVSEISQALPLWDVTPTVQTMEDTNSSSSSCSTAAVVDDNSTDEEVVNERWYILNLLCHTFWPGPLTIVAPANLRIVPPIVMANTSYVAVRYPSHPIAQCLIRLAGVPIAALAGKTVSGKRLNVFNALAGANLPSVTVSVSPASVQEDGTTNLVYTFTRTNLNLSSPLTVNFGASGIANAAPVGSDPADYNVLTGSGVIFDPTTKLGTVTFAAGATTATVEVDPIADTIAEIANETVALTVNSGTGYIGGSPGTATGTIVSEETLPIFSNPNPITIPSSGTSTPYPSTINVSGLSGKSTLK